MGVVCEQALEAAALLIQEGAADRLTLENVAEAASLSIDEIESRWPTVELLVAAVGARAYETYLQRVDDAMGVDETPGAFVRGYLEATFPSDRERDNFVAVVATLFRSAPIGDHALDPVRLKQRDIDIALTEDGIDPIIARILRYAIDGLYLSDVFGLTTLSADERTALYARMRALATPQPAEAV